MNSDSGCIDQLTVSNTKLVHELVLSLYGLSKMAPAGILLNYVGGKQRSSEIWVIAMKK